MEPLRPYVSGVLVSVEHTDSDEASFVKRLQIPEMRLVLLATDGLHPVVDEGRATHVANKDEFVAILAGDCPTCLHENAEQFFLLRLERDHH